MKSNATSIIAVLAGLCFSIPVVAQDSPSKKTDVQTNHYALGISVVEAESTTGGKAHQITSIRSNSPASKAGISVNDFILSVNRIRTGETRTLYDLIQNSSGKKLEFLIERDGKRKTFFVAPESTMPESGTDSSEKQKADKNPDKKIKIQKTEELALLAAIGGAGDIEKFVQFLKKIAPGASESSTGPTLPMKRTGESKENDSDQPALFDRVRISYMEDVGVFAINGRPDDVEKVTAAIRDFIKKTNSSRPRQETVRLLNSSAANAATAISEVYDQQFAMREGPATISPMHNPEGLVVVGRKGAIKVIRGLAKAFDLNK